MTPPIDYSKWNDIDTDSDAESNNPSAEKGKQPLDQQSSFDPTLSRECNKKKINEQIGHKKEPELRDEEERANSKSKSGARPSIINPDISLHQANQLEFRKIDSLPWVDRNKFLEIMTSMPGHDGRPLLSQAEMLSVIAKLDPNHQQGYQSKLEKIAGYPMINARIELNHGGNLFTKLQHRPGSLLTAGPDGLRYSWDIDREQVICVYTSELQRVRACRQGVRELNLGQLKSEWDIIIKRIQKRLSELTTNHTGTKLESFIKRVSQMVQDDGDDFYHLFKAMQFAITQHKDFSIYKDDFMILNDPMAANKTPYSRSGSNTSIFVCMLAVPTDANLITDLHGDLPGWEHLIARPMIMPITSVDLPRQILGLRRALQAYGTDALTVLQIYVHDYPPGNTTMASGLSHLFTLAIGQQGVAVLQSYILHDFAMGFHEWIGRGQSRIRPWPEFKTWLNAFEVATTHAVSFA